jgi:hypothetical protein
MKGVPSEILSVLIAVIDSLDVSLNINSPHLQASCVVKKDRVLLRL